VGVANWEQLALRRNHDGDFEMVSFPTVSMLDNFAGTYVMFGLNDNFFTMTVDYNNIIVAKVANTA